MNQLHDLIFVFEVIDNRTRKVFEVCGERERERGFPVGKAWRHSKKTP